MADNDLKQQITARAGIFPKDFSKHIARLFRERHIGDYDFGWIIKIEDAQQDHAIASELVDAIRAFLVREGYLE